MTARIEVIAHGETKDGEPFTRTWVLMPGHRLQLKITEDETVHTEHDKAVS